MSKLGRALLVVAFAGAAVVVAAIATGKVRVRVVEADDVNADPALLAHVDEQMATYPEGWGVGRVRPAKKPEPAA